MIASTQSGAGWCQIMTQAEGLKDIEFTQAFVKYYDEALASLKKEAKPKEKSVSQGLDVRV